MQFNLHWFSLIWPKCYILSWVVLRDSLVITHKPDFPAFSNMLQHNYKWKRSSSIYSHAFFVVDHLKLGHFFFFFLLNFLFQHLDTFITDGKCLIHVNLFYSKQILFKLSLAVNLLLNWWRDCSGFSTSISVPKYMGLLFYYFIIKDNNGVNRCICLCLNAMHSEVMRDFRLAMQDFDM